MNETEKPETSVPTGEEGSFFSTPLKPGESRFEVDDVFKKQQNRQGVGAIYGRWPGAETDQEIADALKEID